MGVRTLEKDGNGILLPFETKKHKYAIIRPGQPMSIQRWTQYEKMRIIFGTGRTFTELMEALDSVERGLAEDRPFADIRRDSILQINSLKRGVIEMSNERYNYGLYVSTLFVYRDGVDDPAFWDMSTAEAIIKDWEEAALSIEDFFSFAAVTLKGFRATYERIKAETDAMTEKLLAFSGQKTATGMKTTGKS